MNERLRRLVIEAEDIFKAPSRDDLLHRELEAAGGTLNANNAWDIWTDELRIEGNSRLLREDLSGFTVKFGRVRGDFICARIGLNGLEGAPLRVTGDFDCSNNELTTLGLPAHSSVSGNFYCFRNNLESLDGAPAEVDGNFDCQEQGVQFTEADVRQVCKVKGKILV